jgi:hypothetical protein
MSSVSEEQIVKALRRVPVERWPEVLSVLERMESGAPSAPIGRPAVRTGADLANSDLIGIWADRDDITNSQQFARKLRQQASHRGRSSDAAGH